MHTFRIKGGQSWMTKACLASSSGMTQDQKHISSMILRIKEHYLLDGEVIEFVKKITIRTKQMANPNNRT